MTIKNKIESKNQILSLVGTKPIAFYVAFAKLAGSAAGGVWLSQLVYWSDKGKNGEGWIYKSQKEWTNETLVTRSEQESARSALKKLGILEEMKKGIPCSLFYRINFEKLGQKLLNETSKSSTTKGSGKNVEKDKLGCPETTDLSAGNDKPDCGELQTYSTETTAKSTSENTANSTTSTHGGAGNDNNCKNKTTVWHEGELFGSIDEFIAAALWMQGKTEIVRNSAGFKSVVRKRIVSEGPYVEDWETLTLWRASRTKPALKDNPEEAKRVSEKKQLRADAKLRFEATGAEQKKEVESRFAVHLEATNKFAYRSYCKSGLESGIVGGAFNEWLVSELQQVS